MTVLCTDLELFGKFPQPVAQSKGAIYATLPLGVVLRNMRQRRKGSLWPSAPERLRCTARSPCSFWGPTFHRNENTKVFGWKRTTSFLIKSLQICTKHLQGMKFLLQKSKRTSKVRTQNGMSPNLLPLQLSQRPHRDSKYPTTTPPHTQAPGRL